MMSPALRHKFARAGLGACGRSRIAEGLNSLQLALCSMLTQLAAVAELYVWQSAAAVAQIDGTIALRSAVVLPNDETKSALRCAAGTQANS